MLLYLAIIAIMLMDLWQNFCDRVGFMIYFHCVLSTPVWSSVEWQQHDLYDVFTIYCEFS